MIISNSSPLILLSKINKLDILKDLYGKIFISRAVYEEVVIKGKEERYGDAFNVEKKIGDFIFVKEIDKSHGKDVERLMYLGRGEAESIMLCRQLKARALLIDDWTSRKIAETQGIKCRSTLGVIFEALKRNLINLHEYEELIKELARHSWLSGEVVAEFLQAGYKLRGDKK